ncbi:MAG: hypothetical protein JST59_00180 [Actinobacteria bacterium]|nr:hypothetical protein [Actinomycetota bacterium]
METYRIVEAKNKETQTLLAELKGKTALTKQQELRVEKHLIKYSRFLTMPQIKEVCSLASTINNAALSKLFRKVMNRLERHV